MTAERTGVLMSIGSTQRPTVDEPRPRGRWPKPVVAVIALAVLAFLVGGFGGSYQSKLSEVIRNDNKAFLPSSAESTAANNEVTKFSAAQTIPAVIVFHRDGALTAGDKDRIGRAAVAMAQVSGVDKDGVRGPRYAADGTAAAVFAPLISAAPDGSTRTGDQLSAAVQDLLEVARQTAGGDGLEVSPAGPGGLLVSLIESFKGLDSTLLLAALAVVVVILLLVYRSPVLWVFPLLSSLISLGLASLAIYYLAKHDVLTLNGQAQGILFVLVIGAGTDYALLLTARYREELHARDNRFEAMIAAWRKSVAAIIASAATVVIGVLCLMFAELDSTGSMGPVAAIGVGCTVLVMLTVFPCLLALAGRWVFWPRLARVDHLSDLSAHGIWGRIAGWIAARHRVVWIGTTVLLIIGACGIGMLDARGIPMQEAFTNEPEAVAGQEIYNAKFDKGAGAPAFVVLNSDAVDQVIAAGAQVPGISDRPGSICVRVDPAKLAAIPESQRGTGAGCPPPALQAQPVNGRTVLDATLADPYDSTAALDAVDRLRETLHAIPGADALVGGQSAEALDVREAAVRDRTVIIPIVLVVIFLVLALLLRALVVPILLIGSVVLSFATALGVSGFVFDKIFGFPGQDPSFPLFVFVFLIALGIDYNIFLMTRVREESQTFGTRAGIIRGLTVTGGVITSAGVVLAATFAVLGVVPLVNTAEIGFAVAFGVLLDTVIVRSLLVPALSYDIGRRIWLPSGLAAVRDSGTDHVDAARTPVKS
ncbi:integral membrane protein mmpl6 [Nocardia brasiliensis ATCC 700358]|uniref:Integral membrane protein mmpl6 n=2 Tax=Nocardia brasiliensis TaxID=37326 RepID=K0ERV4_NOCB7|nr:integral membrane protein mmpl6 [Nocardia brasiliensis ATCC 700358]